MWRTICDKRRGIGEQILRKISSQLRKEVSSAPIKNSIVQRGEAGVWRKTLLWSGQSTLNPYWTIELSYCNSDIAWFYYRFVHPLLIWNFHLDSLPFVLRPSKNHLQNKYQWNFWRKWTLTHRIFSIFPDFHQNRLGAFSDVEAMNARWPLMMSQYLFWLNPMFRKKKKTGMERHFTFVNVSVE